jgi:hypothetical protein
MNHEDLSKHIRNNLLHANKTKIPMHKVVTGGDGSDHSVEMEHPETHHDHILNHSEHIRVKKAGNNTIEFSYKHPTSGKETKFLRHRIKPNNAPITSSLTGSAE